MFCLSADDRIVAMLSYSIAAVACLAAVSVLSSLSMLLLVL